MPHRLLNIEEAADCLHLSSAEILRLVKDRAIPFEMRGARTVFRKREIEAWGSQRILSTDARRLARYHQIESGPALRENVLRPLLPELIGPGRVDAELPARTKASVLREMVALAARSGWVSDPAELVENLVAREAMSSTGLPGGVALLHPPAQEGEHFERSFLALGRTVQPIHFGASDGRPTRLFFLLCNQDAKQHLVILARLCLLAQETELLAELRAAPDSEAMHETLLATERLALGLAGFEE